MSWKDNLRPATFRGFGFFVKNSQVAGGRRAVQHQYPNRETPFTEDMGRAARTYEIEGYVLGDDYMEAKDELLRVLEKNGPGELIHPYYGSLRVQVSEVSVTESTLEGAIAVFSAKFLEAGDDRYPKGANDKGAILSQNVDKALEKAKEEFDEKFSIEDMPAFAINSARDLIGKAQETFDTATKKFGDIAEGVANAAFATRNLVAETNDLLQSPSVLSQRLLDSFSLMEDAISIAKNKTKSHETFYKFSKDEEIEGDTPIRNKEKENARLFENLMRRAGAVKSSETAIVSDYASFTEAEEARVKITDVIEEQIREIDDTSSDLWQALADVNSSIVEALPDVDSDLPSLKEKKLEKDEVSLLIAYDEFESIGSEQDIIDRNNIRHPGFISEGETLELVDV